MSRFKIAGHALGTDSCHVSYDDHRHYDRQMSGDKNIVTFPT